MKHLRRVLVALIAALSWQQASSTIISRTAWIDLETDGRVIEFPDGVDSWEGVLSIDEFTVQAGDRLVVTLLFNNQQALELTDIGGDSTELTKLSLLFRDNLPGTPPSTWSNNVWESSGQYHYLGVDGELITNPTAFAISGGGFAYQGPFSRENLTDSTFSYTGVVIHIDFDDYELRQGTGVFDRLEWSSTADQVRITTVPEPSTVALMAIGLAGVGLTRRLKLAA